MTTMHTLKYEDISQTNCVLDNFISDLWMAIWSFLPIEDKAECRLVCVKWQKCLDSIKDPEWWPWFLINLTRASTFGTLALQWIEDHTKAISKEVERCKNFETQYWGFSITFAWWQLHNCKLDKRQLMIILSKASDEGSLAIVKKNTHND